MLTVSNSVELNNVIQKNNVIILLFSAPWCQPCEHGKPLFIEKSEEYTNITFVIVNIEHLESDQLEQYNIQTIPTLKKYKNGILIKTLHGINPMNLETICN